MIHIWLSFLFLLILKTFCIFTDDPYNPNPFYVAKESLNSTQYTISLLLKNHHLQSFDPLGAVLEYPARSRLDNVIDERIRGQRGELPELIVNFESIDSRVLHIKITDFSSSRWEVPLFNPNPGSRYHKINISQMGITYKEDPFYFTLTDTNGQYILSTKYQALKFADKYIEFGVHFDSRQIYGLGERVQDTFQLCVMRSQCAYTSFSKGSYSEVDHGEDPGGKGTYSTHPFYLVRLRSGKFIGALFYNSNAQDTMIQNLLEKNMIVTHKTVGGIIDYYVFYPESVELILQKYHDLIGRPYVPPFWSLGFHQSRYGWRALEDVRDVVKRFIKSQIPLDVIWGDIDFLNDFNDFTIDNKTYAGLTQFVEHLKTMHIHWVPIVDAGLKHNPLDKYYAKGQNQTLFIKKAKDGKPFIGKVWPGNAVFIDWMHPNSTDYWCEGLQNFYNLVKYDGIWLDMNEVTNFCDGECPPETPTDWFNYKPIEIPKLDSFDMEYEYLPYRPGGTNLKKGTIPMSTYYWSDNEKSKKNNIEYNLHSLWGLYETRATFKSLKNVLNKRPFILTRSSFPGSGMFSSKWSGDNASFWEEMRYSIIFMFNMQLFGIPHVGADICGFTQHCDEELCTRWMQLGSFYPFSRNHNDIASWDQEPYRWRRTTEASINSIRQKYSILRYYYTKLFEISLNGGSLIKPLFFEFPNDTKAMFESEKTFLIGNSILVCPVLYPMTTQVIAYLPNANWYNLFEKNIVHHEVNYSNEGDFHRLKGDYKMVTVLLRGGTILPYQKIVNTTIMNTDELSEFPMELIIALDLYGNACGTMIIDDGDSVDPIENLQYRYYKFSYENQEKKLTVNLLNDYKKFFEFEQVTKLSIWGVKDKNSYNLNACIYNRKGKTINWKGKFTNDELIFEREFIRKKGDFASIAENQSEILYWKDVSYIKFNTIC